MEKNEFVHGGGLMLNNKILIDLIIACNGLTRFVVIYAYFVSFSNNLFQTFFHDDFCIATTMNMCIKYTISL